MRARDFVLGSCRIINEYRKSAAIVFVVSLLANFLFQWVIQKQSSELTFQLLSGDISGLWSFYGKLLLFGLVIALVTSTIAVVWHRRALLHENVELSRFFTTRGIKYFLQGLKIALIFVAALIVFFIGAFVLIWLFSFFGEGLGKFMGFITAIVGIILGFWLYVIMFRMTLILPASAVEKPMSIKSALALTSGQNWLFVRMILILLGLFLLISIPIGFQQFESRQIMKEVMLGLRQVSGIEELLALMRPSSLDIFYSAFTTALFSLVSLSLLTVLYAHFSKDR